MVTRLNTSHSGHMKLKTEFGDLDIKIVLVVLKMQDKKKKEKKNSITH